MTEALTADDVDDENIIWTCQCGQSVHTDEKTIRLKCKCGKWMQWRRQWKTKLTDKCEGKR